MGYDQNKCVLVLDGALPLGLIANTAAILGATLGARVPELLGADVRDRDGVPHLGIVQLPVPILRADAPALHALRARLALPEYAGVLTVDFSDAAQRSRTYPGYTAAMAELDPAGLAYLGLALYGDKKAVTRLTGSLPLLR